MTRNQEGKPEESVRISLNAEDQMNDVELRKLWNEIMACERVEAPST
ncbi:hypothetical protein [Paenibacillus sp. FSL H8-0034]